MSLLYIIGILAAYVLAVAYCIEDRKGAYHLFPILYTAILIGSIIWLKWLVISWPFTLGPTIGIIAAYFVSGAIWSTFKWLRFNKHIFAEAKRMGYEGEKLTKQKPLPSENKETLSAWILWWPFSIVHYVFGDLLRDFIDEIVARMSGIYEGISNRVFGS